MEAKKEQERLKKIALEKQAHEMQIQELAPKIEAMEVSWNRLRSITGAAAPEEVIAYWEGLKSKEENMRQLVAASEATESNVKVGSDLALLPLNATALLCSRPKAALPHSRPLAARNKKDSLQINLLGNAP